MYIFTGSFLAINGSELMYQFKEFVKLAGWSVVSSSDGTTFGAGDQITTGSSGAGGIENTNSWFVIQQPSALRQFQFRRGSSNQAWSIKYSFNQGFRGGSATIAASASDEKIIAGSSGNPTTILGTDNTYKTHMCADNTFPYAWYMYCYTSPSNTQRSFICYDPVISGTHSPGDPDLAVVGYSNMTSGGPFADGDNPNPLSRQTQDITYSGSSGMYTWLSKGLGQEEFVTVGQAMLSIYDPGVGEALTSISNRLTYDHMNPTSKESLLTVPYVRINVSQGPRGYKGSSTLFRWSSNQRTINDTTSTLFSGSKDRVYFSKAITAPWTGSLTPAL